MARPRFGSGRYGCCGAKKPPGERQNYCPPCKRAYMDEWRAAHHKRGDPYYEKHLARCRKNARAKTREAREDREWRGRRVRNCIAAMNAAGVGCQEMARVLGVCEMSVYGWRMGKRIPGPRNAERVYRLADVVEARSEGHAR